MAMHDGSTPSREDAARLATGPSSSAPQAVEMDRITVDPYSRRPQKCDPCPICYLPCYCDYSLMNWSTDDAEDCWWGVCFCGDLCQVQLCSMIGDGNGHQYKCIHAMCCFHHTELSESHSIARHCCCYPSFCTFEAPCCYSGCEYAALTCEENQGSCCCCCIPECEAPCRCNEVPNKYSAKAAQMERTRQMAQRNYDDAMRQVAAEHKATAHVA